MKLIRLKMVNFKKFRNAQIEFQDGLTGIIGNNGAGKSTIVEAILWSLYGNRALSIKKDFLKNINAKKFDQMSVKLVLRTGNQEWKIYRGIKANGQAEASLEIDAKRIAWSVKDVDDFLSKKLHTSAQDFKKTFYARQKDLDNLLKEGGADKKEYLLNLLNLSDIKPRSIELIRADIKENEGKRNWLDGALKEIGDVGPKLDETTTKISKVRTELDEFEKKERELEVTVQKCEMDSEIHSRKEQSHNHLSGEMLKMQSSLSKKKDEFKFESSRLAEIDAHRKHLDELQPKLERYSQIKSKLEALEPIKRNYETLLKTKEITNKQIEGMERLLKAHQERLSALQKDDALLETLKPVEAEYNKLKKEIPEMELIRDNHNNILGQLSEEKIKFASIGLNISKLEKNLDELKKSDARLCSIKPLKGDYDALQKEHSALRIQKDTKDKKDALSERRNALAEQMGRLSADENAVLRELSNLSDLAARESGLIESEKNLQAQDDELNLNLINLNRASSVCQSKRSEAKANLERVERLGAEGTCPTCERPLGEQHTVLQNKYMCELSEAEQRSIEINAEIQALREKISANSRVKADLKKSFEVLHQDKAIHAGFKASLNATASQKHGVQSELDGINKSIDELGAVEFDPAHFDEVSRKILELEPKIANYDSLMIRLEALPETERELNRLREEQKISLQRSQSLKEKLAGLGYEEPKYLSLKKRKSELEKDHEKVISLLQKVKDIPDLTERISSQQLEHDEFCRSRRDLDQSINNLGFNLQEYEALLEEKTDLSRSQDEALEIRMKLAAEAEIRGKRDDIARAILDLEKDIVKAKDDLNSIGYDGDAHQRSRIALGECKKCLDEFRPKLSGKRVELGVLDGDLERLKGDERKKKEYERERAESVNNLEMLDLVRVLLDGFLDQLLIRIRKNIQDSAGKILQEISGKYNQIKIDEEFNISVEDGGQDYPISRFSGGEIDMIAVSVRIAISEYLMRHERGSSGGYSFLILDEIFGSQDLMHRDNMINTLRRLDTRFPQVIVISHIGDVQGQFDNIISVTENELGDSIVE